eukprot:10080277-Karenia_brevis.AAC.1
MEFVIEICRMQIARGRWFSHEHPASATSWGLDMVRKLQEEPGVKISIADQCMYGLLTWSKDGKKMILARKMTKFMTNCD